jgi:DnaJ-class molecular chaperone
MDFATMPTKSQLGTRYRELMQKHHPDHGGDMATARKIIAAFTILSELVKE